MDYSLTTLFVDTQGGTLATTGSTQNLLGGQIGVFSPAYAALTNGTIAGNAYVYIAQGRLENVPGQGSKRSDKISPSNVLLWYKTVAVSNIPVQITSIGGWNIECGEQISFTFVLHSSYIDTGFFNGLTISVVVPAPCCSCGANPCASVTGAALDSFIDSAIYALQTQSNLPSYPSGFNTKNINNFLTFQRVGSSALGGNPVLLVSELPLTVYGNACSLEAYPYEYDRLWFRAFVTQGPVTTQDFEVYDACNIVATATINQRMDFPSGSSAEIAQLEKNLYSYQTIQFKHLYKTNDWNLAFTSYVVSGTYYDTYYIKYIPYDQRFQWNPAIQLDETVILAFATGTGGTFETMMVTYLGAVTNYSGTNPTTTTTTSTTSTSTTTTTTLIP